jgi:hypothetical protein
VPLFTILGALLGAGGGMFSLIRHMLANDSKMEGRRR